MNLVYIGIAGALGSIMRYLVSVWATDSFGSGFPVGTLLVNLIGSFLIGLVMQISLNPGLISSQSRIIIVAGLVGGFTTYSAFNHETITYLQDGEYYKATMYVLCMLIACSLAGVLGVAIGKWVIAS